MADSCRSCQPCPSGEGGSSSPPSTSVFPGPFLPMDSGSIEMEELAPEYPFTQEREIDTYTRALGRGRLSRGAYLQLLPDVERKEVGSSLKRLYSRGYLTNAETQDVMKLFGGW